MLLKGKMLLFYLLSQVLCYSASKKKVLYENTHFARQVMLAGSHQHPEPPFEISTEALRAVHGGLEVFPARL